MLPSRVIEAPAALVAVTVLPTPVIEAVGLVIDAMKSKAGAPAAAAGAC